MATQTIIRSPFNAQSTALEVVEGHDLSGKVALVTGAASGIGIETARALAQAGAETILAVRDTAKGEAVAQELRDSTGNSQIAVLSLELGSFASIRTTAAQFADLWNRLDLLVNNAGVMASPFEHTTEGFELQFGTNHVGHFLLTTLLLPSLLKSGNARVVSVSSLGHRRSDIIWDDIQFERRPYDPMMAYGQSKTANVLFAVELNARYAAQGLTANAVHPGLITTNLQRHIPREQWQALGWVDATGNPHPNQKTLAQGAATSTWAAVAPELEGAGGLFLQDCAEASEMDPTLREGGGYMPYARSPEKAERLWALTEQLIADHS